MSWLGCDDRLAHVADLTSLASTLASSLLTSSFPFSSTSSTPSATTSSSSSTSMATNGSGAVRSYQLPPGPREPSLTPKMLCVSSHCVPCSVLCSHNVVTHKVVCFGYSLIAGTVQCIERLVVLGSIVISCVSALVVGHVSGW